MDNILIGFKAFKALRKLHRLTICASFIVLGIAFIQNWSITSYFDDHTRQMLLGALFIKWGISR